MCGTASSREWETTQDPPIHVHIPVKQRVPQTAPVAVWVGTMVPLDKAGICTRSKLSFGHFCFVQFIWKTTYSLLFSKYFNLHNFIGFSQQPYKEQNIRGKVRKTKYTGLNHFLLLRVKINYYSVADSVFEPASSHPTLNTWYTAIWGNGMENLPESSGWQIRLGINGPFLFVTI